MKLTLVFQDPDDLTLTFRPVIIAKHESNITLNDIENEVTACKALEPDYDLLRYMGCLSGVVRKFEPYKEFKL